MAIKNKEISKRLDDEIRAVSFSSDKKTTNEIHTDEPILAPVLKTMGEAVPPPKPSATSLALNKRVVTLEYLHKLEQATIASTRYEFIKEFSHTISNLSIVLLTVSIVTYLIFYFINSQSISFVALLLLSLEAFALLGITLYSISKTSSLKQLRDVTASDLSTCSHLIGNPRGDVYTPLETPDNLNA